MAERSLNTRIQNKIDTTANWAKATNFVPKKGEIIIYSDGGGTGVPKMKVGDGATKVGSLKFIESDGNLPVARKISINGGAAATSTSTTFDGTKDITLPLGDVYGSYLSWGGKYIINDVSPLDAAMSSFHNANRMAFANPEGITIEYSRDGGATWVDYGASDSVKISLVSASSTLSLGGNGAPPSINNQLRITFDAQQCNIYTRLKTVLIKFNTIGLSTQVKIEKATIGNKTTFSEVGTYPIAGWSGWNSYPVVLSTFGGNRNQTSNMGVLRFTFSILSETATADPQVYSFIFLGTEAWQYNSNMAYSGHLYSYDWQQNATFPAQVTATRFNGPASSVSNSLSINGKTYNGSAAVDVGAIGAAYGGTGKTSLQASANALLNALDPDSSTPIDADYFISQYAQGGTTKTTYHRRPVSALYTYMKGKMDSVYQAKGTYLTSIPIASSTTLGGVKIGSGLTVAADGTISAAYTLPTASSTTKGGIKVGTGLTMNSETLNHSNSITAKTAYGSTATTASANGGTITVTDVKYDAQGHITGSTDRKITLSQTTYSLAGLMGSTAKGDTTQPVYWNGTAWANTTYTLGASVPADAKFTDTVYTLPTAGTTLGGVKTTSTVSSASGYTACPIINGVVYYKDTNSTYTLAGLMGSSTKGGTTQPVYWNGSAWANTTYTLGASVPANAKFTDTVYSLPIASTSTLGGVKVGTGLQINSTSGEMSVVQVPHALTINGTSYDGSASVNITTDGPTQSETISIAAADWSGSGPYTVTKTLTHTYDSTDHDVIISLPQMSSSDVDKYDAIASAKMVISTCNNTSITIVALGDKPTIPVSVAIMQV